MGKRKKSKFVPIVEEAPPPLPAIHGRSASWNPANRFEKLHVDLGDEDVVQIDPTSAEEGKPRRETQFFRDLTKTIIARNDSPDVGFETSVNPYRGCEHGCIYCFARPTHEYLGMSAGLDFESRIMVKENAAKLLEAELSSPKWKPQVLVMSGVTDPYQPVERKPKIVEACRKAGAQFAGYTIVRLPWAIAPLFEHWLDEHFPEKKEKVLSRIRHIRNGKINDPRWGFRTKGEGIFAEQIRSMFEIACRRAGINGRPELSTAAFRRPREQLDLFSAAPSRD